MSEMKKLYLDFDIDKEGEIEEYSFGTTPDTDIDWMFNVEIEVPLPVKKGYKVQITEADE